MKKQPLTPETVWEHLARIIKKRGATQVALRDPSQWPPVPRNLLPCGFSIIVNPVVPNNVIWIQKGSEALGAITFRGRDDPDFNLPKTRNRIPVRQSAKENQFQCAG